MSDHVAHRGGVAAGNSDIVVTQQLAVHQPVVHQPAVHQPAVHQCANQLSDAGSRKTQGRRLSSFLFLLTPPLNLPVGTLHPFPISPALLPPQTHVGVQVFYLLIKLHRK